MFISVLLLLEHHFYIHFLIYNTFMRTWVKSSKIEKCIYELKWVILISILIGNSCCQLRHTHVSVYETFLRYTSLFIYQVEYVMKVKQKKVFENRVSICTITLHFNDWRGNLLYDIHTISHTLVATNIRFVIDTYSYIFILVLAHIDIKW